MSTPVSVTPPQRRRGGGGSSNQPQPPPRGGGLRGGFIPPVPPTSSSSFSSLMDHMQRMIDLQYAQQQLLQQQQQPDVTIGMRGSDDSFAAATTTAATTTAAAMATMTTTIAAQTNNNNNENSAAVEAVAVSSSSSSVPPQKQQPSRDVATINNNTNSNNYNNNDNYDNSVNSSSIVEPTIVHQDLLSLLNNNNQIHSRNSIDYGSFQGSFDSVQSQVPHPSSFVSNNNNRDVTGDDTIPTMDGNNSTSDNNHPNNNPGSQLLWRTSSERLLATFRHQDSQNSPLTPSYSTTTIINSSTTAFDTTTSAAALTTTAAAAAAPDGTDNATRMTTTTTAKRDIQNIQPDIVSGNTESGSSSSNIQYRYDPTDADMDQLISSSTRLLPSTAATTNNSSSRLYADIGPMPPSYGSTKQPSVAKTLVQTVVHTTHSNLDSLFVPSPPPPPPPTVHRIGEENTYVDRDTDHHQEKQRQMQEAIFRGFAAFQQQPATTRSRGSHNSSYIHRVCSCCYEFLYYHCIYPIQQYCIDWYYAESLHRSFCYGAIDGMLTGAGIVSTFCGMGLLSTTMNNSPHVRALIVVFAATTCLADAICMAIGHVWTTHVMYETRSQERQSVRQQLFHRKHDAKGMLVDLLLSRGMLTIDAMSIADTLEGYPDLFINVLTGDALSAGGISMTNRPHINDDNHATGADPAILDANGDETDPLVCTIDGAISPGPTHHHQQQESHRRRTSYPSYGRLTEYEMDPDTYTAHRMTNESLKESGCMMIGFVVFAVVPSIIYTLVPSIIFGPHHDAAGIHFTSIFTRRHSDVTKYDNSLLSSSSSDVTASSGTTASVSMMMNPNTIIILCTASIMWCLGVWKSQFVNSSSSSNNNKRNNHNWFVFGIETVIVLLICIGCAYGVGTLLNHTFLPNEYVLQVVQQQKIHSYKTTTGRRYGTTHSIVASSQLNSSSLTNTGTLAMVDTTVISKDDDSSDDTSKKNNDIVSQHPHHWYSF